MTYRMFLDDVRDPSWVYPQLDSSNWIVCRSFDEAQAVMEDLGWPEWISFDHDLGDDEASGFDLAKHLINWDLDTHSMPPNFHFEVHSANPEGAANIRNLLSNYLATKSA